MCRQSRSLQPSWRPHKHKRWEQSKGLSEMSTTSHCPERPSGLRVPLQAWCRMWTEIIPLPYPMTRILPCSCRLSAWKPRSRKLVSRRHWISSWKRMPPSWTRWWWTEYLNVRLTLSPVRWGLSGKMTWSAWGTLMCCSRWRIWILPSCSSTTCL